VLYCIETVFEDPRLNLKKNLAGESLAECFQRRLDRLPGSPMMSILQSQENDPNNIRLRRVTITPTLVLFNLPEPEETNRVLRQYRDSKAHFLRVCFTDETGRKGHYFGEKAKPLLHSIFNTLREGLPLLGKEGQIRVKALSYSNSQLKNHSLWMLREDEAIGLTVRNIIKQLGEFGLEENPLKRLAR